MDLVVDFLGFGSVIIYEGFSFVFGGVGDENFVLSGGNDMVVGGEGVDIIDGGFGDDWIEG